MHLILHTGISLSTGCLSCFTDLNCKVVGFVFCAPSITMFVTVCRLFSLELATRITVLLGKMAELHLIKPDAFQPHLLQGRVYY